MATYVIGDIQGCYFTFRKLLDEIKFDQTDKLILLGDIINRGPHSLKMMRFVREHHTQIDMVLGNHEIFAIALFFDAVKKERNHTLQELFQADDKLEIIQFLRKQPLIRQYGNAVFVHAGILPAISIPEAIADATQLSSLLADDEQAKKLLERYYNKTPTLLKPDLRPKKKLRLTLAYLTLIRMCETPDSMDLSYSGTLDKAPKRLKPWFSLRQDGDITIYFGHWATLGFYQYQHYVCLDSACVWGNKLTALRLEDAFVFQVDNIDII